MEGWCEVLPERLVFYIGLLDAKSLHLLSIRKQNTILLLSFQIDS